jgi:hypothetical protein
LTRALRFHADEPDWARRHWLLDASLADRVMEELIRALYRSQIAVLARYADLDRLTPEVRAQVRRITTEA